MLKMVRVRVMVRVTLYHEGGILKKISRDETEICDKRQTKIEKGFKTGDILYHEGGSVCHNVKKTTPAAQLKFYKMETEELTIKFDKQIKKV